MGSQYQIILKKRHEVKWKGTVHVVINLWASKKQGDLWPAEQLIKLQRRLITI
jgi:hypothetical protein